MKLLEHIKKLKNNIPSPSAPEYLSLYYQLLQPELRIIIKENKMVNKSAFFNIKKTNSPVGHNGSWGYSDKTLKIDLKTFFTKNNLDRDNGTNI
jgi:hypothetical protein